MTICFDAPRQTFHWLSIPSFLYNHRWLVVHIVFCSIANVGIGYFCNRVRPTSSNIIAFTTLFDIQASIVGPWKIIQKLLHFGALFGSLYLTMTFQQRYPLLSILPIAWQPPHTIAEMTARNFQLSGDSTAFTIIHDTQMVFIAISNY